ncbi:MAG: DUF1707 domain-containing protein [Propioniciclava sp.]
MELSAPDPSLQPGHMRVGDTDRTLVADLLAAAYAEGRLGRDEHDGRLAQAMTAKTYNDLREITRDLVPAVEQRTVGAFASERTRASGSASVGKTDTAVAIFSAVERKGAWHVPTQMVSVNLFGGSSFDFRDAIFETNEVVINACAMFGGIDIKVPHGVGVRNETVAIFGGTSLKRVNQAPGGPTIVLKGLLVFGGIEVTGPRG